MASIQQQQIAQVLISAPHGHSRTPEVNYFKIDHPFVAEMLKYNGTSWGDLYGKFGEKFMEKLHREEIKDPTLVNFTNIPDNYVIKQVFRFKE